MFQVTPCTALHSTAPSSPGSSHTTQRKLQASSLTAMLCPWYVFSFWLIWHKCQKACTIMNYLLCIVRRCPASASWSSLSPVDSPQHTSHRSFIVYKFCLQGQLCDQHLWFWLSQNLIGIIESLSNHVMNNDDMSYSQKWRHIESVFADSIVLWITI